MTPVKETDFFASYNYKTHELGDEDFSRYEAFFEGGERAKAVGEISVGYLSDVSVPERVHRYLPDVRLVVSLRNPIDQIYSHYWHLNRQNFHQWYASPSDGRLGFEEALEKYHNRLVSPAYYATHLRGWLKYFDRSQIHIILYDEIVERPDKVLTDLYAFLGVEPTFRPAEEEQSTGSQVRQGTSPRSPLLHQIYLRLYAVLSRGIYYPLKRAIGVDRAASIISFLKVREIMEKVFRRKGYPKMRASTRKALSNQFQDEVRELERILGRDLNAWLT